jgi:uncharacterized membrane protein
MNFNGVFCNKKDPFHGAVPGECAAYSKKQYRVGIIIHLVTIMPAGFLALLQFVPVIRHKFILFHRINGYIVLTLFFITIAGALMIARVTLGGSFSTQLWIGLVAIISTTSLLLAYINIKRYQIDQHRKWMLRAWFYVSSPTSFSSSSKETDNLIFLDWHNHNWKNNFDFSATNHHQNRIILLRHAMFQNIRHPHRLRCSAKSSYQTLSAMPPFLKRNGSESVRRGPRQRERDP